MESIEKASARRKPKNQRKRSPSPLGSARRKLNLGAAIRILKHAGRPDPTETSVNPHEQLQTLINALCELSVNDGLTGLVNATFFHAVMSREIDRSARTGRACGLIMIDIDHFKNVNDTYGHRAGDLALEALARQLKKSLRSMDTAARVGGEEFAVILPECSPEDAIHAAKRLHAAINPFQITFGKKTLDIHTSMGLVWTEGQKDLSSKVFLAQADQEMYRAKREGRSRLCHPPVTVLQVSPDEREALFSTQPEERKNVR
jgi:diguanylate cyclase